MPMLASFCRNYLKADSFFRLKQLEKKKRSDLDFSVADRLIVEKLKKGKLKCLVKKSTSQKGHMFRKERKRKLTSLISSLHCVAHKSSSQHNFKRQKLPSEILGRKVSLGGRRSFVGEECNSATASASDRK